MQINFGTFSMNIEPMMIFVIASMLPFFFIISRRPSKQSKQFVAGNEITIQQSADLKKADEHTVPIIDIDGIIVTSTKMLPFLMKSMAVSGEAIATKLYQIAEQGIVKKIVLRVNTPGGALGGTKAITDAIKHCRQKGITVIVHTNDVCASGGTYLASAASQVFCESHTLYGSIGVIGPTIFEYKAVTQVKDPQFGEVRGTITAKEIAAGEGKALNNPFNPNPEAVAKFQSVVDEMYSIFVSHVAESRSITVGEVRALGAHVYSAAEALKHKLIDNVLGFNDLLVLLGSDSKETKFVLLKDQSRGILSILSAQLTQLVLAKIGVDQRGLLRTQVTQSSPIHVLADI